MTTTVTMVTSPAPKAKLKAEPVSAIETEDTSDDDEGEDTSNVT